MSKRLRVLISILILCLTAVVLVKWNSIEDYLILSKSFKKPTCRIEAWHQDLNYLKSDYLKVCRSFDDEMKIRFISNIEYIENNIDSLTNNEIIVKLIRTIALANDAHSNVKYGFLPKIGIRVYWFKEGLYITKASFSKKHHLGKRITKINNLPINKIISEFNDYIPGNIFNKRLSITNLIIRPDFWNGINRKYHSTQLVVEMMDSLGQIEIDTFCIEPIKSTLINLYYTNKPDSVYIKYDKPMDSLPLFLSSPYKAAFCKKFNDGLIYIQLNSSTNRGIELEEFANNLKGQLNSKRIKNIIFDIRLNSGGNYNLTEKIKNNILQNIAKNKGHLYLITGNQTASAALNLAAALKSNLKENITIVGEPVGDSLIFWAEPKLFKLSNSKLEISASTYQHDLKNDKFTPFKTNWGNLFRDFESHDLKVEIPVGTSINDYIAYKDPVMIKILELIENE